MPLKLILKPQEKIIIAGAVVTNGKSTAHLIVENNVPVLREKDILKESETNSPARRIYFVIQMMYIDRGNLIKYHAAYWRLVRDFLQAAPSGLRIIDAISEFILGDRYYQALRETRKLMDLERRILSGAGRAVD
ncbi:MAG: flagellar biosynthesis repressor FlbT [Thermodesulfobacteriota bacterium]